MLQFATSSKEYIDNWNISTVKWLRLVSYERSGKHKYVAVNGERENFPHSHTQILRCGLIRGKVVFPLTDKTGWQAVEREIVSLGIRRS